MSYASYEEEHSDQEVFKRLVGGPTGKNYQEIYKMLALTLGELVVSSDEVEKLFSDLKEERVEEYRNFGEALVRQRPDEIKSPEDSLNIPFNGQASYITSDKHLAI